MIPLLSLALAASSYPFHVYVGNLSEHSLTLAWGHADGRRTNTIGYGASSTPATVAIAGREIKAQRNWVRIEGLASDTDYPYTVKAGDTKTASGSVRTWPERADSFVFFVIGDWGTGKAPQYAIASRMESERARLASAGTPVRFIVSTGDNIYRGGAADSDWERKFFTPYHATLSAIPFYAVPGNHDGNESERGADLPTYLDNFFFPSGKPARWYSFTFGNLAEFFALDSTANQWPGSPAPAYLEGGEQSAWLRGVLARSSVPWRIAVLHHPLFTAGPNHLAALPALRHWLRDWQNAGVSVVFSGHEHNLQFSERSDATGGMQFVVSGAGGQLRQANVRTRMNASHIAAWAPRTHFLEVEIAGASMRITPVGDGPITLRDAAGRSLPVPWTIPCRTPAKISVSPRP